MMNKPCKNVRTLNVILLSFVEQMAVIMPLEFRPVQQVVQNEPDHSIKVATFE